MAVQRAVAVDHVLDLLREWEKERFRDTLLSKWASRNRPAMGKACKAFAQKLAGLPPRECVENLL